jgi:hypothetical protein
MAQIDELLELLNTLILSFVDNTVTTDIAILTDVLTCLQDLQDKIEFLQLESQLQQDEIQQKNHHSEPVLVHNNYLFKFENDPNQQPTQEQLSETAPNSSTDEVQLPLSKPFIRSWEEIRYNKHRTVLEHQALMVHHTSPGFNRSSDRPTSGYSRSNDRPTRC